MTVAERRSAEGGVGVVPSRPPLRGTQSFVSVMAQVWKRPGLTGLELLWRWFTAVPLLGLAMYAGSRALRGIPFDLAALQSMSVFKPTEAAATMGHQLSLTVPPLWPVVRWWGPLALLAWSLASGWGRTILWRRLDSSLQPRPALVALLSLARSVWLLCFYAAWIGGLLAAGRFSITGPAAAGAEPNLVLYVALAVGHTLLLFMLWSLTVWALDAAPIFAMAENLGAGASLRAALAAPLLRSKLIETNLVMGIVKVALLVLAMVFSACPLPFATVETTSFLAGWWSFVAVLFLAFLDLFHVVRRAAYLALFRAIVPVRSAPEQSSLTPQADIAHASPHAS